MKAWMKAAAVPCVAVLTSWPLAAPAQDDHGDTRATATVVQAPSTTAGDLEEAGDRDWFRFELPGAGRLTVQTTGRTDTFGRLFRGRSSTPEGEDDDGGSGNNFRITADARAGTWYVEVRGFDYNSTGAYTLRVETTEPPEPPGPPEPPEPETPEPETPEPETPEPEACPAEPRCDHLAIIPAMPKALPGDEGAADHWLRISNPGAASITFTVTGRNDAGTKGGTYRRELPAHRSVKVVMRDVEAAFDVEAEGWWTLTVTGSGPLYASATMLNHGERRFVPVRTPATCTSGPVTRTGG